MAPVGVAAGREVKKCPGRATDSKEEAPAAFDSPAAFKAPAAFESAGRRQKWVGSGESWRDPSEFDEMKRPGRS